MDARVHQDLSCLELPQACLASEVTVQAAKLNSEHPEDDFKRAGLNVLGFTDIAPKLLTVIGAREK